MTSFIDTEHFLNLGLGLQREVLWRAAAENEDGGTAAVVVAVAFGPVATARGTNAMGPVATARGSVTRATDTVTNQSALCGQDDRSGFVHIERRIEG